MQRIDHIRKMLAENGPDSFLEHALALELIKEGDEPAARLQFEALLARDPEYLGSYYHLAKLYERQGSPNLAIQAYEKGIALAGQKNDRHSLQELRNALDELQDS
jgi:Tfp pilus assembly protein PilF